MRATSSTVSEPHRLAEQPERQLTVLLDQNVSRDIKPWLRELRPSWRILHTSDVGLQAEPDDRIVDWAISHEAVVITFNGDFADKRNRRSGGWVSFASGSLPPQ